MVSPFPASSSSSSQGPPIDLPPSSRLQPPPPASSKPPPPGAPQGGTTKQGDIPTYDEAVAESIASHQRQSQCGHLSPPPAGPQGGQGGGAFNAELPHRVILISHPGGTNHPFQAMPLPPPTTMPTVVFYTSDPGAARRRALARFLKAFLWAWLISMLIAFLTGAIQFVDYDDDGEDWNGWRVTGINVIRSRSN